MFIAGGINNAIRASPFSLLRLQFHLMRNWNINLEVLWVALMFDLGRIYVTENKTVETDLTDRKHL